MRKHSKGVATGIVAGLLLPVVSLPAAALDIVLTNDDGFETKHIQALYHALIYAGHNVVMSAPYLGQSGSGGEITFLTPVTPTRKPSEGGLLPAGSPGVGPTTVAPQQYYVNGSPVDAMLHGVDVIAPKVFSGRPDLVISGPNEGNNLGLITPHSGTLGAAVAALNKNIPAIAVSADRNDHTQEEADLIAALTLKVVAAVDGRHGVRLPRGTGLNVNIPDVDPATAGADDFKFRQTRVGLASNAGLQFYERLGDSPIAQSQLPESYWDFPGLSVEIPYTLAGHPQDNSRKSEANVVGDLTVSVSPIQGTYAADRWKEYAVRHSLRNLFHSRH